MRRAPLLAALLAIACHGAPAGPAPVPTASSSASAPSASASVAPPAIPSALAAFRGHGSFHRPPIALPPDENGERWLVFVGTERVAVAAWLLTPGAKTKVSIAMTFATGSAVRAVVVKGDEVFVLLESVAVLDQPAGLWGVERIALHELHAPRLADPHDRAMAVWGVKNEAALAERVEKAVPFREGRDAIVRWAAAEKDLKATLAGWTTEALLGAAISTDGLDVFRQWQGVFVQPIEHRAMGKTGARLLEIVRTAGTAGSCTASVRADGGWCRVYTADGVSHEVLFEHASGRWTVRALLENVPAPAPVANPSTPAAVARSTTTSDTEGSHAMLSETGATAVAEARLSAQGGSVGLMVDPGEPKALVVVVHDGDFVSLEALVTFDGMLAAPELRFADLDGDGRTDVIVRRQQDYGDGKPVFRTDAFLTRRTVEGTHPRDLAAALAMFHATSADAAVTQALTVPTRGSTRAEVCKLLTSANDGAALAAVSAPGASLLLYDDPLEPTLRPKKRPIASATKDHLSTIHDDCAELVCDPSRPVCELREEPGLDVFWLTWNAQNKLQIAGIALYTGS